jgi:hypothetical protein
MAAGLPKAVGALRLGFLGAFTQACSHAPRTEEPITKPVR